MATQAEVAARMIATLGITEPDLDTSVGSVTRKIIDAVAQSVADSYVDQHLLTYQYDIDSKIEADLDDFVQLFGISRLAAKRATGVVTFYRGAGAANTTLFIPVGTQVASTTTPSHAVQTVTGGFMPVGVVSVDVPVQAVESGPVGNLGAGLLTLIRSPLEGIPSCTNISPLTGGTQAEGDRELRARWKRTVFRSLAGTEPMYAGIALNDPDCGLVNVVGASKTYREQVQIVNGVGVSSIEDAAYVFGATPTVGVNIDGGQILVRDLDYRFDANHRSASGAIQPRVIIAPNYPGFTQIDNDSGTSKVIPIEGAVLDLSFQYAPKATRNLPNQGITNRVDVWCAGTRARAATQTVIFQTTISFRGETASPYFYRKFVRPDQTNPARGNVFIPLAFGPIITLPTTLSVDGKVYYQGSDYHIVHDNTAFGYAPDSLFGIEWERDSLPERNNVAFDVGINEDYIYNEVPRGVQDGIDRWRLTGIDAKAHQAKTIGLRFALAVMYAQGADQAAVNSQIEVALSKALQGRAFGGNIQASDVILVVHSVAGVDNVRFLTLADWPNKNASQIDSIGVGMQRVVNGLVVESYAAADGSIRDVIFGDDEVPVFDSIVGDVLGSNGQPEVGLTSVRAQNTFFTKAGG